jgi:anti-anti-sigma regulatory factor
MTASRRWEITQRQAGLAILTLAVVASWLALVLNLVTTSSSPVPFIVGGIGFTVLLFAYWRLNWKYAPHVLLVLHTALIGFALPEPYVTQKLTLALLTPPLLALVLLDSPWIIGVGLVSIAGALIRAGGHGPLGDDPIMLLIAIASVGMIVLGRQVTTTALRQAERNAQHAEAARTLAETRSAELSEANELMNMQLDQQDQLLKLVATLETPVVKVAEGVLFAPLVGHLDSRRAAELTSRLLREAHAQRARRVILDIAGVPMMDTQVAQALINTAHALQLLGCSVTVSSISSTVAMTLTHLGVSLSGITTARDPQEALAESRFEPLTAIERQSN